MSKLNMGSDLNILIEKLEDIDDLCPQLLKRNYYHDLLKKVEEENNISRTLINRLLVVCTRDLKVDLKCTVNALSVICSILKKLKTDQYPDLAPVAVEILHVIKRTASLSNVETFRSLCFNAILLYPDDVLGSVVCSHSSPVMEIIDAGCTQIMGIGNRTILAYPSTNDLIMFFDKILKALPNDKKELFVKEGLVLWFSNIIPALIQLIRLDTNATQSIEVLELLTELLLPIDYAHNPHWADFMGSIDNPQKYPAVMKTLLQNNSDCWHRLWIVFIKMLKTQITKINSSSGSPINSLLPVVELAFKMDPTNRCRAFLCWNVLIDNFSSEVKESYKIKQLKLLIVPLTSSNAKVVETALAKLNTWWHLIRQFQNDTDKNIDMILVPFLHFCFGKKHSRPSIIVPGQLSNEIKLQCLQVLVEIFGHTNCSGCVELPRLKNKLMNTNVLVNNWNDWMYSLKSAFLIASSIKCEASRKQVTCLWKSFLWSIGELPTKNVRKDLFNAVLKDLDGLLQMVTKNDLNLPEIIFEVLIKYLFENENSVKQLLKTTQDVQGPMYKILLLVTNPLLDSYYESKNVKNTVAILKVVCNVIFDESVNSPDSVIDWMFKNLRAGDITLMLWMALTECLTECEFEISASNLCTILLWPLEFPSLLKSGKAARAWYNWYTLYNLKRSKLNEIKIDDDILNVLSTLPKMRSLAINLPLSTLIAVMKHKLINGDKSDCERTGEVLWKMTKNMFTYDKEIFPIVIDTLVLMVINVTETVQDILAKYIILTVKVVFLSLITALKHKNDAKNAMLHVEVLLHSLNSFFSVKAYSHLKMIILGELIALTTVVDPNSSTLKNIISLIKLSIANVNDLEFPLCTIANVIINIHECDFDANVKPVQKYVCKNSFPTPDCKLSKIKSAKKEARIVNTVVENGEEYVVVKSHWKFNPKKFTENQKEKMKRKREDIPALYQDLSQSQDEFKLSTWKTDSQDVSTNSSKSHSKSTNEDISMILKTMPSTDVVPKIMETMLGDVGTKTGVNTAEIDSNIQQQPKDTKSPRIALKDRVFRNVRNLIEKSSVEKEATTEYLNQSTIENVAITPPAKQKFALNTVSSAPSKIISERPSRVIKKPKKYDDSELIILKKRRRSQNDSQSDSTINDTQPDCETISKPYEQIMLNMVPDKLEVVHCSNDVNFEENALSDKTNVVQNTSICTIDSNELVCEQVVVIPAESELNKVGIEQICHDNVTIDTQTAENICTLNQESVPHKDNAIITVNVSEEVSTPNRVSKSGDQKSSSKKKRSRIEKQLLIDTVEGHPFLQVKSEKRVTRKTLSISESSNSKRKSLSEKLHKLKMDSKSVPKDKKTKEKEKYRDTSPSASVLIVDSQERLSSSSQDLPQSEDIIESSQDSTLTTLSVKSAKQVLKKTPVVILDGDFTKFYKFKEFCKPADTPLLQNENSNNITPLSDTFPTEQESKEDVDLPRNRTLEDELPVLNSTENMDTEPICNIESTIDVTVNNDDELPTVINTEDDSVPLNTLEVAEADTLPIDIDNEPKCVVQDHEASNIFVEQEYIRNEDNKFEKDTYQMISSNIHDPNKTTFESLATMAIPESSGDCSPLNDEPQRKKDFLNDTVEISPIKVLSPLRDKQSPSPETSSDYVVIKLTSPVQSNGEPFGKCNSPEIFTAEKISPEKRDQSPPRAEVIVNNTSPSSSLSLKKNRPQVRSIGRAAQMLGLCAPDKLEALMNSDRSVDLDETKKSSPLNTPARRNLRILYNSVGDNVEIPTESEDSESFLKLKRSVPTADCSPSVPILKRKLADIADEATISPANKRKRVSFHDPPVSTTIAVQKYIEPCGRSPRNYLTKRLEMRSLANLKSPKRLDTVFKLDSALTNTVESFSEDVTTMIIDDTEISSMDETPEVKVIKTSNLNDTDAIYPNLVNCNDSFDQISSELSCPGMNALFLKAMEGKLKTVGDFAKMTELEVYRLCIKAPKVEVAKKVLANYSYKIAKAQDMQKAKDNEPDLHIPIIETDFNHIYDPNITTVQVVQNVKEAPDLDVEIIERELYEIYGPNPTNDVICSLTNDTELDVKNVELGLHGIDEEIQTDVVLLHNSETQTNAFLLSPIHTQTDTTPTLNSSVQTEESGNKSTKEIVASCLHDRPDFVEQLGIQLREPSIQQIADTLPFETSVDLLMKKMTTARSRDVLNRILEQQEQSGEEILTVLQDYLCNRFDSKELVLFCSKLLQKIHDKSA